MTAIDTPPTDAISSYAICDVRSFKKKEVSTFLKARRAFPWRDGKGTETKVAEECCWAITQAVGRPCCGRAGSSMVEFGFQVDPFLYTYIVDDILSIFRFKLRKIRLALDNPERNSGLSRRVESINRRPV